MTAVEPVERTFPRPGPVLAGWFVHFMAAWITINGFGHLRAGEWIWGVADLAGALLFPLGYRWALRVPIARVTRDIIELRPKFLARPLRLVVAEVVAVEQEPKHQIRFTMRNGDRHIVQLEWFRWEEQLEFLASVRSVVGVAS